MQHSIAAKYAARPAARFVRPSARTRERRLGLRPSGSLQAATGRATVLRRPDVAPLTHLRAGWRAITPAEGAPSTGRTCGSVVSMRWATASRPGTVRRSQRRVGAVARLRSSTATSAGGIVVRYEDGQPWLVVGSRRRERDGRTWTLPKGTPNAGETTAGDGAPRSDRGDRTRTSASRVPLDSIDYDFIQSGRRIHKTVHYFLMEPTGGGLDHHDHEFDEVRWIRFDEAPTILTFETRASPGRAGARASAAAVRGGVVTDPESRPSSRRSSRATRRSGPG